MLTRILVNTALMLMFLPSVAVGQTACGNTKLACLIPTVLHTPPATFNFFNSAFGTQISQLPLPSRASGFLYTFDKSQGVYAQSQLSFGPVLTERAETIGRGRAYFSTTYQRFSFSQIDNNSLQNLPILFYFPNTQEPLVVTSVNTRVSATINQYVGAATFGVTDRLDVSIAVPFARVSMGVSAQGTEYSTMSSATATFSEFLPGEASGAGDVVISAKHRTLMREKFDLAVGGEFRIPSGDAENFLGSGAFGLEPYVVISHRGRLTPHLDLAYQWNSHSVLATNASGQRDLLPGFFSYTAGADFGVTRRVTVTGDLLGQVFFNAPQVSTSKMLSAPVNNASQSFKTIVQESGSYPAENLALGVKANLWNNILITGNVTLKLNNSGLRATAVPLVGISYTF